MPNIRRPSSTPELSRKQKHTFTVLLLFIAMGHCLHGQAPAPLLANVGARATTSLDGTWHIIVDPYETGLGERYYLDRKPADKTDRVEYNFDESETLKVPGDWNTQKEKLLFYEGPVWYRAKFPYHTREARRLFVYFGAAANRARVYLNGKKLGEHEGGFTPFDFEITNVVREGDNSLVVEVDNSRRENGVPALKTDWWNYGGLTRDVMLVEVPETRIQDYWIQLDRSSVGQVAGWVQLAGSAKAQKEVTIAIPEAGVKQSATTNADGRAEFHLSATLKLWSPDNPKLYDVMISTASDQVQDAIGFRTIEVRGTQLLLNGKPIFLRGIAVHEEAPFRSGRAYSPEDAATLFGWAKELNCNFVRLAHYPHNENEIRAADRMGLLVWSEIPVYWDMAWNDPVTLANAKAQLTDIIARDHNRASVIFWSVSNETPIKAERTTFLHQLADEARRLDNTRLITSAMDRVDDSGPNLRTLNDPLGEYLDVLGLNEYVGWYWGKPEDADHMQWKMKYEKPLIVSEFGGDALYGNHGDAGTRWTEEYQANLFAHQIEMVKKIPNFAGMSPWVLMDFRTPRRPLPVIQDYFNRKGMISSRGEKKKAFGVLQKYYEETAANSP
jgi:beta-glucuronidase